MSEKELSSSQSLNTLSNLIKFLPKITLVARQSPQCWSLQSFKSIFSQRPITHEFINNIFWLPIFYKRDSHKLNALLQFQLHKRFTWQNLNLSFILRFPLIVWIPLLWFLILSPEICLFLNYAFLLGYSKHSQAMRRSFIKQHSMALPVIRSQLDYVLRNGMNSSFEDYTNHLHETVVNAYRRSIVPTPENVKVEKLLHNIKKVKMLNFLFGIRLFLRFH